MYYILLHKFFRALQSRLCKIPHKQLKSQNHIFSSFSPKYFVTLYRRKGKKPSEQRRSTEPLPSNYRAFYGSTVAARCREGISEGKAPPSRGRKGRAPQKKSRGADSFYRFVVL